jgi:hypothetical protein
MLNTETNEPTNKQMNKLTKQFPKGLIYGYAYTKFITNYTTYSSKHILISNLMTRTFLSSCVLLSHTKKNHHYHTNYNKNVVRIKCAL